MKKIIIALLTIITFGILFSYGNKDAIAASAVELHVRTELLSESEYPDSTAVSGAFEDDTFYYRVIVSLDLAQGDQVATASLQTYCDMSNFTIIMRTTGDYAFVKPYIKSQPLLAEYGAYIACDINYSENMVAVVFMSNEDIEHGGDLFSFYAKANNKQQILNNPEIADGLVTGLNVPSITNSQTVQMPPSELEDAEPTYLEVLYYHYVVGSIAAANGSQPISLADAQRLQSIVNAIGPISVDATLAQWQINALEQIYCPGLYIDTTDFDTIIALRVADIDGDGDVDQDDADELLDYYVHVGVMNMSPPAGTRIGTTESIYHIVQLT